jgi:hypothetical protein
VLLTGSGDELCGLLTALLQAVAYHLPTVCVPTFPGVCLPIVHKEISFLLLPASLMHFQCSHPLCCVLVFISLFIVKFFFCGGWGKSVCPGCYASLSHGWLGEYRMTLGAYLFGLNVSQAGLELAGGSSSSSPVFSMLMWRGEAFCRLGV